MQADLSCPSGQAVYVTSGFWGRGDSRKCSRGLGADQLTLRVSSNGVLQQLQRTCSGMSRCHVNANATSFGEPRPANDSTPIYLIASYSCQGLFVRVCSFILGSYGYSCQGLFVRVCSFILSSTGFSCQGLLEVPSRKHLAREWRMKLYVILEMLQSSMIILKYDTQLSIVSQFVIFQTRYTRQPSAKVLMTWLFLVRAPSESS